MSNTYNQVAQAMNNPMAVISQMYKVPMNMQNPQGIAQYLLDSGQITQQQLNQKIAEARNNPILRKLMK